MAYEIYFWTVIIVFFFSGVNAVTTIGISQTWHLDISTKKVFRRISASCLVLMFITGVLQVFTLRTDLVEEKIVESYTLIPFSDGEYYKKENGFLLFCHFSEPDEHFWLSTDFSSASDKTVAIEKFESYDVSVEEVFSPDSNKKAFEILQQTTVEKAKLPFGIVLTSDKHREKEFYRLRLTTLDESLPKTSYS